MIMMRFRHILIIFLSALAVIACEKEDFPGYDAEAIDFNVTAQNIKVVETKSTLVNNTLPDGTSFGVLGYCIPYVLQTTTPNYSGASGEWSIKVHNSYPDIFYNQKVDYNDGICTYDSDSGTAGSQVKGWVTPPAGDNSDPSKYTYTFFAYYPYLTSNSVWSVSTTNKTLGAPKFTFSMPFTSATTSTSLDDAIIPDAMVASTFNRLRANGAVPLNFNHILSGINIKVANYDARDISVNSVTLSGTFNKTVAIDFNDNSSIFSGTYSGSFTFSNGTQEVLSNASVDLNGGKTILLLSNTVGNGLGQGIKLDITYSIDSVTTQATISIPADFKPVQGTNYTLTLNFVNGAITLLTESDSQWENGGDSSSTIK